MFGKSPAQAPVASVGPTTQFPTSSPADIQVHHHPSFKSCEEVEEECKINRQNFQLARDELFQLQEKAEDLERQATTRDSELGKALSLNQEQDVRIHELSSDVTALRAELKANAETMKHRRIRHMEIKQHVESLKKQASKLQGQVQKHLKDLKCKNLELDMRNSEMAMLKDMLLRVEADNAGKSRQDSGKNDAFECQDMEIDARVDKERGLEAEVSEKSTEIIEDLALSVLSSSSRASSPSIDQETSPTITTADQDSGPILVEHVIDDRSQNLDDSAQIEQHESIPEAGDTNKSDAENLDSVE